MNIFQIVLGFSLAVVCTAQSQQYTTPIPILKQINRHNEDGSYSYGYEGADGSYKIESKYPDGRVFGKYGYVDEGGKLREVEYGASKNGFEPVGSGINVPPPTIHQNSNYVQPLGPNEQDDGQYREDPSIYYKDERYNRPSSFKSAGPPTPILKQTIQQPAFRPQPQYSFQQPQQQYYNPPQPQQQYYNQQYQPQAYNPIPYRVDPNLFRGHPATNFDIASGSYSINYTGPGFVLCYNWYLNLSIRNTLCAEKDNSTIKKNNSSTHGRASKKIQQHNKHHVH